MDNQWVVGILTGIASSAAFVLVATIGKNFLVPHLQSLLYRVPQISGEWNVYQKSSDGHPTGTMILKQRGTKIHGMISSANTKSNITSTRRFKSMGEFQAGQLAMIFEEQKKEGYNIGTAVLKLGSDGDHFEGRNLYWNHDRNEFSITEIYLRRIK